MSRTWQATGPDAGPGMGVIVAGITTMLFVGVQARLLLVLLQSSPPGRQERSRAAVGEIGVVLERPAGLDEAAVEVGGEDAEYDKEYLEIVESLCAPDPGDDGEVGEGEAIRGSGQGLVDRLLRRNRAGLYERAW